MPGPAMKLPGPFPGIESLPDPVRQVVEFFFPQDDVVLPATTAITAGPEALVKALAPLSRGSIQRGKDVARELATTGPVSPFERPPIHADPAAAELVHMLRKPEVTPDPLTMFRHEKHTPSMVPPKNRINAPEGVRLPRKFDRARDPLLDELYKRQQKFYNHSAKVAGHRNMNPQGYLK